VKLQFTYTRKSVKMIGIRNKVMTAVQASVCSSVLFSVRDGQIYMTVAFLSVIVVAHIRFFRGALQLCSCFIS